MSEKRVRDENKWKQKTENIFGVEYIQELNKGVDDL